MKTATHSEREKFVALLIRNCPTATASTCQRLMRLGATHNRLAELVAAISDKHDDMRTEAEARMQTIKSRVMKISRQVGMNAHFNTAADLDHSIALTKGDVTIGVPTS